MLHELEPAALSYSKVLSLAPHHTETRMILASLYSQLGMTEDALALLDAGVCVCVEGEMGRKREVWEGGREGGRERERREGSISVHNFYKTYSIFKMPNPLLHCEFLYFVL